MNKPITKTQLDALEAVIDQAFGRLGIDVEFTRHFLDRVNDTRNRRQITIRELGELFAKEYRRWGRAIAKMPIDAQAVMKDLSSDINIPFVLNPDGKEKDLVAKTVMRKQNFHTPDRELPVESIGNKHGAKKGTQVRGRDATPKTSKPSRTGQQRHPMRDKLVGEEQLREERSETCCEGTLGEYDVYVEYYPRNDMYMVHIPEANMPAFRREYGRINLAEEFGTPEQAMEHIERETYNEVQWIFTKSSLDEKRKPTHKGKTPHPQCGRLDGEANEPHHYTSESIAAAWQDYQMNERIVDPREAILRQALSDLDQKVQQHQDRQSLAGYAFEIAREINLEKVGITIKDLVQLYRDWRGDTVVTEGWMESNLYYLDEVINPEDNKI